MIWIAQLSTYSLHREAPSRQQREPCNSKVLLAAAADVIKLKSEPGMAADMREKKTQQFYSMEIKLLILTTQLKETGF